MARASSSIIDALILIRCCLGNRRRQQSASLRARSNRMIFPFCALACSCIGALLTASVQSPRSGGPAQAEPLPVLHERTALVESIAPLVGALDLVAVGVLKGRLSELVRLIVLVRPIGKGGAEPVQGRMHPFR